MTSTCSATPARRQVLERALVMHVAEIRPLSGYDDDRLPRVGTRLEALQDVVDRVLEDGAGARLREDLRAGLLQHRHARGVVLQASGPIGHADERHAGRLLACHAGHEAFPPPSARRSRTAEWPRVVDENREIDRVGGAAGSQDLARNAVFLHDEIGHGQPRDWVVRLVEHAHVTASARSSAPEAWTTRRSPGQWPGANLAFACRVSRDPTGKRLASPERQAARADRGSDTGSLRSIGV